MQQNYQNPKFKITFFKSYLLLFLIFLLCIFNTNTSYAIMCSSCHGIDGNSFVKTWPKIGGQYKKYIISQLLEFKKGIKGNRYDPIMLPIAKNIKHKNLNKIALFYSNQTMLSNKINITKNINQIYLEGNINSNIAPCASCHGFHGRGNFLANFPRLAGQHSRYTINQMKKYQSLSRKTDPLKIMRTIMNLATVTEMEMLGTYISVLK